MEIKDLIKQFDRELFLIEDQEKDDKNGMDKKWGAAATSLTLNLIPFELGCIFFSNIGLL